MTPQEIAQKINALPEAERLAEITKFLEMIQAAILLKELFGMEWKDEPEKTPRRKRGDAK
ncbi:MAG TPA: hypothetical protein VHM90_11260 [Phycisphaerae bacterium]|nr:hypothetical protein [Phycisphaerae bacterium]